MMKVTLHPAERNNYKRFYDMSDAVYEIETRMEHRLESYSYHSMLMT